MKSTKTMWMLVVCVAFAMVSISSNATVYLDEDFEGATIFTDRDWAIKDSTVTPITPAVIAVKGINLHSYSDAAAYTVPKVTIGTNQGSVVTERFFLGAKSYKLTSGQALAVTPNGFSNRFNNYDRIWQFAISTDGASAGLAAGTRIGHFKIDFGTDNTDDTTVDVTVQINLVTNASGKVDIVASNTSTKVGELTGQAGNWALLTIVSNHNLAADGVADAPIAWKNLDPVSGLRKGPPPVVNPPDQANATDYYQMPTGVNIFVNSNTQATILTRANSLGDTWGNWGARGDHRCPEIQWEFAAENGGTIYIDNFNWNATGVHNGDLRPAGDWLHVHDAMARLLLFDQATSEPTGPKEADAKSWWLY